MSLFDNNMFAERTFTYFVQSCHETGRHRAHNLYPLLLLLIRITIKMKYLFIFFSSLHLQELELGDGHFQRFAACVVYRTGEKKKTAGVEINDATATESAICKSFICFVGKMGLRVDCFVVYLTHMLTFKFFVRCSNRCHRWCNVWKANEWMHERGHNSTSATTTCNYRRTRKLASGFVATVNGNCNLYIVDSEKRYFDLSLNFHPTTERKERAIEIEKTG